MGALQTYRRQFMAAAITVSVGIAFPLMLWMHNAYADARYVSHPEAIRAEIRQLDNALFEADQEISFAVTIEEKAKFIARHAHYDRQKQALILKLESL